MKVRLLLPALVVLLSSAAGSPAQELKEARSFPGHKFQVDKVVLSVDGKFLAAGGSDDLRLWDTVSGKEIGVFAGPYRTLSTIAFSSDGKRMAAGGYDAVAVWEIESRKKIASFETQGEGYQTIALSSDGMRLGATSDRGVKVWDLATGRERNAFHLLVSAFRSQAFSPDFKTLAARNFQEVELWDLESRKQRLLLSEHRGEVCCLEYSADGKTLVSASVRSKDDIALSIGEVKQWDLVTGKERAALNARLNYVWSLALSPDGKTLAVLDLKHWHGDLELRVFDFPSGRERLTHKGKDRNFQSVAFRNGKLFVLGAEDTTAKLWEAVLPKD